MASQTFRLVVLLLTILQFSGYSYGQRSIDPAVQKAIDDFIQNLYLPISQISGIGLSVYQDNGEVLYTTGYGLADMEKEIPNGNDTQFLIGSTSKSFTAAVVIRALIARFPDLGEAVLDTPIRKLLPEANFTLIDRFRSEQATFRDLLAHRLCIFRDDFQLSADPFDTTDEIVYRERYAPEICSIRNEFQYNNQMYVMAGHLAGIAANRPYPDLMQDLLNELGMVNSAFTQKTDDFSNMPFRAQPHYVMDNVSYPYNTELVKRVNISNAAGGLFVPPNDMVKYIQFHLNSGNVDGRQVIPEEAMKWFTKPSMHESAFSYKTEPGDLVGNTFSYGLGLFLASYDGWNYIHHGGYFPPYHTLLSLFPTQNLGIYTSTNHGPAYVDASVLHAFIFETLQGSPNAAEKAMKMMVELQLKNEEKERAREVHLRNHLRKSKAHVTKQGNEVIGKYGSGGSGDLEIDERHNDATNTTGLYLNYTSWANGWLESVGGEEYIVRWETDLVQDDYAGGSKTSEQHLTISNGTLEFYVPLPTGIFPRGKFQLGVSLDTLPPIPWAPDSCGPE